MLDYYAILGVNKNAPNEEIKQAYRRLARRYHPDANPGNKAAEEKFKDINEAYEILGDRTRRVEYDRTLNPKNATRTPVANPFSNFSRGTRSPSKTASGDRIPIDNNDYRQTTIKRERVVPSRPLRRDIEAKLTLPLDKAYRGGREKIRLEDGRSLDVEMPAGMLDGQRIRLKGQGIEGGNLYLKITVARHPVFNLQGADIYCKIPVTPSEAVLGSAIEVPTLDGLVKVTVPAGVRSGQRLRLANKGYPLKSSEKLAGEEMVQRGDQMVEIQIVAPRDISPPETELYEKLRQLEQFNPRQNIIKNL